MSEEKADELGLTPRARFHTFALAGVDPVRMLTGPIPATQKALERSPGSASTTSISSRSTRRSPRWCWPGRRNSRPDMEQGERQRRRHRPGSPARLFGHQADVHAAATSSSAPVAVTASRRCVRAAAWQTPPSSSASIERRPRVRRPFLIAVRDRPRGGYVALAVFTVLRGLADRDRARVVAMGRCDPPRLRHDLERVWRSRSWPWPPVAVVAAMTGPAGEAGGRIAGGERPHLRRLEVRDDLRRWPEPGSRASQALPGRTSEGHHPPSSDL